MSKQPPPVLIASSVGPCTTKSKQGIHTCQVLGKSKSEIARAPLIFAYNLVIEHAEKSEAQV